MLGFRADAQIKINEEACDPTYLRPQKHPRPISEFPNLLLMASEARNITFERVISIAAVSDDEQLALPIKSFKFGRLSYDHRSVSDYVYHCLFGSATY